MKNWLFILITLLIVANSTNASVVDTAIGVGTAGGVVGSAIMTKSTVDNSKQVTDALVRNIDAQTENIKKYGNGLKIVPQADGTAKVYQNGVEIKSDANPNSMEYKMGLKMAESMANYFERKEAKAKIKEIKATAKIENDTKKLEIIKKYKKAGAIVTLKKLEELE